MTLCAVWGRRLAIAGLGVCLALGTVAPRAVAAPNSNRGSSARLIYHKSRNFRVPFNVDPADQARLKEVQLWVSEDGGYTWKRGPVATPDHPSFTFRARRDAEYWFAVRTLDAQGKLYPSDDDEVEPKLKVVVDTVPPTLRLDPAGRKGTLASVRWEIKDDYLDLKSLVLEYQVEEAREWRKVPNVRPRLIGSVTWDAGTAERLKVRATVSDRAGNTSEEVVALSEGSASNPGAVGGDFAEAAPPPISQVSSGPNLPPPAESASSGSEEPFPAAEEPAPARTSNTPAAANESDPFPPESSSPNDTMPAGGAGAPAASGGSRTLLVPSPRFPLKYAVDDAGPNGPNIVELWITQDRGATWVRRGEDPDRVSPFPVDLGGDGTFGICLVARSASGLGDTPPSPGDPPQFWVEVDSKLPDVQILPVRIGNGQYAGKIAIYWQASDLHLQAKPIRLYWRTEQAGSRWIPINADPIENVGHYVWTVPGNVPPRFHLRVEAMDEAGNRGFAESPENAPILLDRTRPRSRIIGLDRDARAGGGSSPSSLR